MIDDALKLTVYFGERDRARGGFLADALTDVYERESLLASLLLRGTEGFGVKHHMRTDRLLTLSEDLPLVSIAVDRAAAIQSALADLETLDFDGLITLERARMLTGSLTAATGALDDAPAVKLTLHLGRHERAAGRPAYATAVDVLHREGVAGATVLLGVDGTAHGIRRRAQLLGRNAAVPLLVVAVGAPAPIDRALRTLDPLLPDPLATIERAHVCRRDGQRLADPPALPERDAADRRLWQKLTVYAGEQSRHAGRPLHHELVRALRRAGASGATSLRGIWGYHGDHRPHGDTFWQLRRRVPVVTTIVDTPARISEWWAIVDELTDETGLVTSEIVPAFRATGDGDAHGALDLADPKRPPA